MTNFIQNTVLFTVLHDHKKDSLKMKNLEGSNWNKVWSNSYSSELLDKYILSSNAYELRASHATTR